MKRKLLITVLLLSSIFVFSSIASAGWYEVTVNEAGIDTTTGATFVNLTYVSVVSGSGSWPGDRWFSATGENAKALLAVGLSCVSIGSNATANLPVLTEWSTVSGLFMKGQ